MNTYDNILTLFPQGSKERELIETLDPKVRTLLYYRFSGCSKASAVLKTYGNMNSNSATKKYNQVINEHKEACTLYLDALERVRERKGEVTADSFLRVLHNIALGETTTVQPLVVDNKVEYVNYEPTLTERIKSSEVGLRHLSTPKEDIANLETLTLKVDF